jgi:hypothetical protein
MKMVLKPFLKQLQSSMLRGLKPSALLHALALFLISADVGHALESTRRGLPPGSPSSPWWVSPQLPLMGSGDPTHSWVRPPNKKVTTLGKSAYDEGAQRKVWGRAPS